MEVDKRLLEASMNCEIQRNCEKPETEEAVQTSSRALGRWRGSSEVFRKGENTALLKFAKDVN